MAKCLARVSEYAKLVEVSPRDGLQNIKTKILAPEVKATYINQLLDAGIKDIEIGSFVSDKIAQMRSTREIIAMIDRRSPDVNLIALVGNAKYAREAVDYPIDTLAVFTTVSETFCARNNGCDTKKNMSVIKDIASVALKSGKKVRGYVSCVFGCPYEGYNSREFEKRTVDVVRELLDAGCYEVSIADTIGTANEDVIASTIGSLCLAGIDITKIAIHLHDPRGGAFKNLHAAVKCGVKTIDCGTGNIGGCPNVPNPSVNIETSSVYSYLKSVVMTPVPFLDLSAINLAAKYINHHITS